MPNRNAEKQFDFREYCANRKRMTKSIRKILQFTKETLSCNVKFSIGNCCVFVCVLEIKKNNNNNRNIWNKREEKNNFIICF